MRRVRLGTVLAAALAAGAGQLAAQGVPAEVSQLDGMEVTLHRHAFLSDEELALLRLVGSNAQMLELMLGGAGVDGHAAMAVAPDEGLLRDGAPAASAHAVAQLPDAATARSVALEGCEELRSRGAACVVVLEVGPIR